MTEEQRLLLTKQQVNARFADDDVLLSDYLEIAKGEILAKAFPYGHFPEDVPPRYHVKQTQIAAYLINKRGADYQTQHSENGIQRTYEEGDVPASMLRDIIPYCGAIYGNSGD